MSPLKQEEDKYCRMVYPTGMYATQRQEIAMAFNAGALSTMTALAEIAKIGTVEAGAKAAGDLMKEIEARCAELCELPKANPHN